MGLFEGLRQLFSRRKRDRHEPLLLGGVEAIDPFTLINATMKLTRDVDKALQTNNPRFKRDVLVKVEELLDRCEKFVEISDVTYVKIGPDILWQNNLSKRQELASDMIPLLERMKKQLSE